MSIKKHIPNFITSCNLACGCLSVVFAHQGHLLWAVYLIWLAMFFDFFDGLAARLLKVASPIGKELDSLADLISFGMGPATILYVLIAESPWSYLAFLVVVFSALRLAKFNIDESQQTDFIGLPTPANALFLSSLVFVADHETFSFLTSPVALTVIAIIFSLLLVSPIRMFSLKAKNLTWRDNKMQFILLLLSVSLLAVLGWVGLPLIILAYITLSIIKNFTEQ